MSRIRYIFILVLALTAVVASACSGFGFKLEDGAAVVSVSLPETRVQQIVDSATVCVGGKCNSGDDQFFTDITGVDFREGLIHITGDYEAPDGTVKEGSYDISFNTEDGRLVVRMLNVNVEGVDQSRIDRINADMASDFAKNASEGDVQFTKAQVTDSELVLEIRANLGR